MSRTVVHSVREWNPVRWWRFPVCGCRECTDHYGRRRDRRRSRHEARVALRLGAWDLPTREQPQRW